MSALRQPLLEGPQLIVLRHAPLAVQGKLCGRTDADARIDPAAIAPLARLLETIPRRYASPARRCQQTAQAIWGAAPAQDHRLWEQSFGIHDGQDCANLPDLGRMTNATLAEHRATGGESFADLCARTDPAFRSYAAESWEARAPVILIAHAGVARAAIAHATGAVSPALSFEIDPLSLTRLRVGPDGAFSVIAVNEAVR